MREEQERPTSLEDGTSNEPEDGPLDEPDQREQAHGVPEDDAPS
jgi:hypothetical protein